MTTLQCLTQLFTAGGLLCDADGDGLPDGFGVRFSVGWTPGAVDVAARLGLETAGWTPGFTAPDAPGVALIFGPSGNRECPDLAVPAGCGLVALTPAGVVVTGDSDESGWDAARWLAMTYPFVAPGGPLLCGNGRCVTAVVVRDGAVVDVVLGASVGGEAACGGVATLAGAPAAPPFAAVAPGDLPPAGLASLFTVAGLLGSSDSARHDRAGWRVWVGPHVTPAEIAGLCELAARTGVEATGLRFPLAS
ncbi:MAG: hypothetical protein K0R39_4909, partial [Symbiobacteriaceae bacterium]|nr:hypothetical protein [Symbiobacteriaceae bacterium]